jgi:hypothetical protein
MLFVGRFRRSGAGGSGAESPRFDPAENDWTGVTASFYFFEPWCGEFAPPGPGEVVIAFGEGRDRHRGLQVDVWKDGKGVSLWLPDAARVFWSPEARVDERNLPWETRLRELDATTGTFLDES